MTDETTEPTTTLEPAEQTFHYALRLNKRGRERGVTFVRADMGAVFVRPSDKIAAGLSFAGLLWLVREAALASSVFREALVRVVASLPEEP